MSKIMDVASKIYNEESTLTTQFTPHMLTELEKSIEGMSDLSLKDRKAGIQEVIDQYSKQDSTPNGAAMSQDVVNQLTQFADQGIFKVTSPAKLLHSPSGSVIVNPETLQLTNDGVLNVDYSLTATLPGRRAAYTISQVEGQVQIRLGAIETATNDQADGAGHDFNGRLSLQYDPLTVKTLNVAVLDASGKVLTQATLSAPQAIQGPQ